MRSSTAASMPVRPLSAPSLGQSELQASVDSIASYSAQHGIQPPLSSSWLLDLQSQRAVHLHFRSPPWPPTLLAA